jgi:sugar lactone lactonase YvrE
MLQGGATVLVVRVPPLATTGNITVEVGGQIATGPSFQLPPLFTLTEIKKNDVALLYQPNAIDIDVEGNFYVTDYTLAQVNKITPSGTVTRVAGQNYIGNVTNLGTQDGPVATAKLSFPHGLSLDKKTGDIYFLNSTNVKDNGALRKITPSGIVSTVAKGFNNPTGVVQDAAGNFYVADYGNFCVKKVTPSGTVSILAGSGSPTLAGSVNATGTAARFTLINSIAIDTNGNIYVAEWGSRQIGNGSIRKITPDGVVSTYYTYPTTGFVDMFEVAADAAGNVYASGEFTAEGRTNYFLNQITPSGNVRQLAFSTVNSNGAYLADGCTIPFGRIAGITVDEKNKKLILLLGGISQLNTIPL